MDPAHAYVQFCAASLHPDLAAAAGGTWDVTFYFGPMDTPTTTPETTTVEGSAMASFDAAALTGLTSGYLTAAVDVPALSSGMKLMWVEVETTTGAAYQLGRTVSYEQSAPPPPPGAPRVPNAIGGWPDAWGSGYESYHSGVMASMMDSDDAYYTLVNSNMPLHDSGWADCCLGYGMSLTWTGFEIPAGATEMRVRLEYHVYDPEDGTGQNGMPCADNGWCFTGDVGGDGHYPNMCYAWGIGDNEAVPGSAWVDGVNPCYGWGLVMVNWADCWDFDGSGTGSPSAEIQDTPAEGGQGGAFAYNPTTDMAMEWAVSDWTNFVQVGAEGNEAAIFWCGGCIYQLVIDKCTLEFNPH
jgi:hypothetical protein